MSDLKTFKNRWKNNITSNYQTGNSYKVTSKTFRQTLSTNKL